jgi:hypothetical protein
MSYEDEGAEKVIHMGDEDPLKKAMAAVLQEISRCIIVIII